MFQSRSRGATILADMKSMHFILLFLLASTTAGFLLPTPPGRYNVTLTTGPLTDYTRNDPDAPSPTPRALMLSIFQPATCVSTVAVPYMPNKTAAYQGPWLESYFNISADLTPIFLDARLPVCPACHTSCSRLDEFPILLFSPGYLIPRFYYNVIAAAIASEGFNVITIDHPYDANILVYPDGHAVYNNASITGNLTWDDYPRAADASFIIDQLGNATAMAELLPQCGPRSFSTDRIAMFGHSEGGSGSIIAASRDARLRGAINWDGTMFGAPPLSNMTQPVLFMSHQNYLDDTWQEEWPQINGPKMILYVSNTTHETFSDAPTLLQAAGVDPAPFEDLLGSIPPARMVSILVAFTVEWMHGAFAGKERAARLERLQRDRFPEVSTLLKDNF